MGELTVVATGTLDDVTVSVETESEIPEIIIPIRIPTIRFIVLVLITFLV
jgi:hypothetical protein